jgi:O-antigen/teichoic acid export membrane protein
MGVFDLGLGEATLKYVAQYHGRDDDEGIQRVFSATLAAYLVIAGVAAMAVIPLAPIIVGIVKELPIDSELAATLFRIAAITFLLRLMAGPFLIVPCALRRYDVYAAVTFCESLLRVIVAILLIENGGGIVELVVWNLILTIGVIAAAFVICRRLLPHLRWIRKPTRAGFSEVFSYGVFAFLARVFGLAWKHLDELLLAALVSSAAIAHFAVPKAMAFRLLGVLAAGAGVLMPTFSAESDREKVKKLYCEASFIFLAATGLVFVPMAILGKDLIHLWMGDDFAVASGILPVMLAASCIIRGPFMVYESLFRGLGKPSYILVITILVATVVVAADLVLIPRYGLRGAGIAFCLTPLIGVGVVIFAWFRFLKIQDAGLFCRAIAIPGMGSLALFGLGYYARLQMGSMPLGWLKTGLFGSVICFIYLALLVVYIRLFMAPFGGIDPVAMIRAKITSIKGARK